MDGDDVQKMDTIDSLGRTQRANHVNESGLYSLILGSRKPEAKRFKKWVTSEVLPAIRKTGSYSGPVIGRTRQSQQSHRGRSSQRQAGRAQAKNQPGYQGRTQQEPTGFC